MMSMMSMMPMTSEKKNTFVLVKKSRRKENTFLLESENGFGTNPDFIRFLSRLEKRKYLPAGIRPNPVLNFSDSNFFLRLSWETDFILFLLWWGRQWILHEDCEMAKKTKSTAITLKHAF